MADKQIYRFNNDIEAVEVTSIGAKIFIRPNTENEIYVEYENPRDTPEFCAVLSGKTLTLKENLSFSIFGVKPAEGYNITVLLPETTYARLKVNTASGGAQIEGVRADSFDLNTASGDINVNAYFPEVKIQSASGNVILNNPTDYIAKSVKTCTVSGTATITGYKADQFSIHSVSGRTTYDAASGTGEISVTSGTVDVTYIAWQGDLNVSAISGNVNLAFPENAGLDITFNGMSGMVKTDIGNSKGNFMNLGKGTNGQFGGENLHKLNVNLTSGIVTAAQA